MIPREVIRPIASCRVCGNRALVPVIDLGWQTLTGRFQKPGDPDLPKGPLEVVLCHGEPGAECCGLLQLRHSCDPGEMFGETYGYRSSMNATMIRHLRQKTGRLLAMAAPSSGDRVLDIGSNDGTLLRCYEGTPVERFGIDPSSRRFASEYPSDVKLIVDFFAGDKLRAHSGTGFKIITSLAMFYDVETPLQFMDDIHSLLAPDGIWEFEQSYMPDMLDRLSYDTICHEHISYYGMRQIAWMAARSGLKILDVELNAINGGSFSVLAARRDAPYVPNTTKIDLLLAREFASHLAEPASYRTFARQTAEHREQVRNLFGEFKQRGQTILGYGASTKGNVMLQYWGLTPADMPAIAEKHPGKLGFLTPGTRIPIVSESEARNQHPDAFLVLPWHFKSEIIKRESEFLGTGGQLLFPLPELHSVREIRTQRPVSAPAARLLGGPMQVPWARPVLFGDERSYVLDALESTMLSDGPYVRRLEAEFAQLHGISAENGISVSNGTTALYLALLALGIGPGDEVIVPGWGFAAAANMVLTCGATPVFADILADTWLMDPAAVDRLITRRTRAIIAIHTYGVISDMPALSAIGREHRIPVIEDCAEAPFSRWDGKLAGTMGDIGCFSFQSTKTITCGEGGLVLVRDGALAEKMRLIRSHGMESGRKYWHLLVGHNFRLTNIQAAVLCAQMQHLATIRAMRQQVYSGYRERLANVGGIQFQRVPEAVDPVMWAFAIRLDEAGQRKALVSGLAARGIETRPAFHAFAEQPVYRTHSLPNASSVAKQVLSLPSAADLSGEELDIICAAVADLLSTGKRPLYQEESAIVTQ